MTTADDKKEGGLPIYDAYYRYTFLNDKKEINDNFGVMNLLIVPQACQAYQRKDYNCKKANHNTKMISKKRLEKSNNNLVVKINQT